MHHEHVLPNGLTIYAEPTPTARSFSAGLFVRTGSRDEPKEINGVSHFLEHMMFKGSQAIDAEAMNRIFDELGARYNAFTSQEMTAYYATVLPEFTPRVMAHLGELLRPALRQADFDTEKNVILEEIAMYEDEPGHRLFEEAMRRYFGQHSLGMSILGPADCIRSLRRDQMDEYFRAHYGPRNMILSVTGLFDFNELVERAAEYYGGWEAVGFERELGTPEAHAGRFALTDPKLNRLYLMGLCPGPGAQHPGRYAARMLADIIGDNENSRLYWALVDNAICEEADLSTYPHDQTGNFVLSLTCEPDRLEKALEIATAELRRVKSDLTEQEVERSKNKMAGSAVLHGESATSRMRAIGSGWVYHGRYVSLDEELQGLLSVTRQDLLEVMEAFPFDSMAIVTLGPE